MKRYTWLLLFVVLYPLSAYSLASVTKPFYLGNITNQTHKLFLNIAQYQYKERDQDGAFQVAQAVAAVIEELNPQITAFLGKQRVFTANCSIFFNDRIEEGGCDVAPAEPRELTIGIKEIFPGSILPLNYHTQITKSHILFARAFLDFRDGKLQKIDNDLFFRGETPTITESVAPTATAEIPLTPTFDASSTITTPQSMTDAASSSESETDSADASPTATTPQSATEATSDSESISESKSETLTPSVTASYSLTPSTSLIESETSTFLESGSKSELLTSSVPSSKSATETESVSHSPIPTVSISQTISCPAPPIANWNASTGIYEDATNQNDRYKVEDGVVTDTFSNLQWEQAHSTTTYNGAYANNTYCQAQNTGGYTGWRLPTVLELQSLVDYTIDWTGAIAGINSTAFPNTPLSNFWSSTPMAGSGNPDEAWYVSYGKDVCHSGMVYSSKWGTCSSINKYLRCVSGISVQLTTDRYEVIKNVDVVKDKKTGLLWEKQASSPAMAWSNALTYCNNRTTGGKSGWRLPTVKELSTLSDYSVAPGELVMDNTAFAGEPNTWFWSSSPVSGSSASAWGIDFNLGYVGTHGVVEDTYDAARPIKVRCVCFGSDCQPIANWSASTGIYEDATNQTDRYRVEDGVVTDTFSNLQWEQANSTEKMYWANASDYCASRTTGDCTGWCVPTVFELQSLVDYTITYNGPIPGINTKFFPNTPTSYFWSSTPMAGGIPEESWYVSYGKDTNYAGLVYSSKWDNYGSAIGSVRCVRCNNSTLANRYDTSTPGVVKDKKTGLLWEKQASNSMVWSSARTYCNNRPTGGKSGWRLPTVKELSTLLNYSVAPGGLAMDNTAFAGEPNTWFWSSSPVSGGSVNAWGINFSDGYVDDYDVSNGIRVRCCIPSESETDADGGSSTATTPQSATEAASDSKSISESKSETLTPSTTANTASKLSSITPTEPFTPSISGTATKTSELCTGGCARTVAADADPGNDLGSQQIPVLSWELGRKDSTKMIWSVAKSYCTSKGNGWHLPSVWELYALYQQKNVLGADLDTTWFWSASLYQDSTVVAWLVYFSDGYVGGNGISSAGMVRCCVADG